MDVRWASIIPMAPWSIPGSNSQNGLRLELNAWLRENFGERVVDCEEALLGPDGVWVDPNHVLPWDGVHLSREGALAHAECIAEQLGLALAGVTGAASRPAPR